MATATCKLMYNITIHMTGYGVRILLTGSSQSCQWQVNQLYTKHVHLSGGHWMVELP